MKFQSIIKTSIICVGMIISFNLAAIAKKTDCSKKTDKDIVLAVYDKMKDKYDNQISHINVRSNAGVVTVEGWVIDKKDKKKIEKLIKKITCVKQVIIDLGVGKTVGCGPGQQECGGTCISAKETCNICLVPGKCN